MVSIILPVYNAGPYLEPCLESVTEQSYEKLQILLIDDGSTDGSRRICASFAGKDPRILFRSQKNAGVSAARNLGISLAEGEWLLFVDADDVLPPGAVEILVASAEGAGLVIGSHREFRGPFRKTIRQSPGLLAQEQFRENFSAFDSLLNTVWGKLYRRQVILDKGLWFDESLPYCEDHVFNLEYAGKIQTARVIAEVCYHYRLGGAASSLRDHPNLKQCEGALLEAYQDFFRGNMPEPLWEQKRRAGEENLLLQTLVHRSYPEARKQAERLSKEKQLRRLCRKHWWRILGKKIKIALWRRFGRRI